MLSKPLPQSVLDEMQRRLRAQRGADPLPDEVRLMAWRVMKVEKESYSLVILTVALVEDMSYAFVWPPSEFDGEFYESHDFTFPWTAENYLLNLMKGSDVTLILEPTEFIVPAPPEGYALESEPMEWWINDHIVRNVDAELDRVRRAAR